MTLRKKIFIIVALTFLGLTIVFLITSNRILLGGLQEIETMECAKDLKRSVIAIKSEVANIDVTARDYANWDDMYAFAISHAPAFLASNFTASTFIDQKLNFIIITDRPGNILYSSGFDLKKKHKIPISKGITEGGKNINRHVFSAPAPRPLAGIELLPEGLAMIAARPILNSNGKGDPRGLLIIGRIIDSEEMSRLESAQKTKLSIFHKSQKELPPDISNILKSISADRGMLIEPLNTSTIAGYALLTDLFGKSSLIVRTLDERAIFMQGRTIAIYGIVFVLFAAFVFTIVSFILLEKLVLRRLLKISNDIKSIESDGNLSKRIELDGKDELTSLTCDINLMLDKLENSETKMRNEAEKFRAVIEDQTEFICRFDQNGALTFVNDAYYRFFRHNRRDLIGRNFLSFVPKGDTGYINELLSCIKPDNPVVSYENRVILPDGEELWQHWTCRAIHNDQGELIEYQAVGRDISDRKQAENELLTLNSKLEEANVQLGSAYANMKNNLDKLRKHLFKEEFALLVDRKGQICGITERVLEYMQLSRSQIIGANMSDYLPDMDRDTFVGELQEAWIGITKQTFVQLLRPQEESESQFFEMKLTRLTLEGKRMLLVTLR